MGSVRDSFFFFSKFLRSPRSVASVWPSSRFLARQMFADLPLQSGDSIIELGPGTGAFTAWVDQARKDGLELRYVGIDREPEFCERLRGRFPALDFVAGDAADIQSIAQAAGLAPVKAVISGLPLIAMPLPVVESIVAGMREIMAPDGEFRTFSYVHSWPSRGAFRLRKFIRSAYGDHHLSAPVWRNTPPAYVLSGRGKPTATFAATA